MIFDNLSEWRQYAAISPRFQKAFAYLEKFDDTIATGRYDLDGDNLYALVQKYTTKGLDGRLYEAHRQYLDIQYVHTGRETILWAPLAALTNVNKPYDAKTEAALFGLVPNGFAINLTNRQFTVLFPGDGHVPCTIWDAPSDVTKVVVKVRI